MKVNVRGKCAEKKRKGRGRRMQEVNIDIRGSNTTCGIGAK
jgi:hypothetical protein